MNRPNNNGQSQFDQNTMGQLQQASVALQQQLQQMNMTNGTVSQERYEWARQMANAAMGTNY